MKILKSFTLKWWQVILFKLTMLSFGIAIGATWPAFFGGWIGLLWSFFVVLAMYTAYIWLKQ